MKKAHSLVNPPVAWLLPLAAFIGILLALATGAAAYQQQVQTAAERIGESMTKAGKKSVAVVDFTDLQGNATELGRFLAEQLSVALGTTGGTYETIDRNHLRAILQEHKLSTTGLVDPQTARKVGQMAGAECLVSGSITPFSESLNISIKLLDTNTAKILGGVTVDIPRTSTINELLARSVGNQVVNETASPTSKGKPTSAGAAKSAPVTAVAYGVEVSISECKKSGHSVTCQGTLKNGTDAVLHVYFPRNTEVTDNLANRSRARAGFGPSEWYLDLEPDLPVKFLLQAVEIAPEATSLTARITMGVRPKRGSGQSGGEEVVVLRNIPLH